jgi:hypothetical protein
MQSERDRERNRPMTWFAHSGSLGCNKIGSWPRLDPFEAFVMLVLIIRIVESTSVQHRATSDWPSPLLATGDDPPFHNASTLLYRISSRIKKECHGSRESPCSPLVFLL